MAEEKSGSGKNREKVNGNEKEIPVAQALAEKSFLLKRIYDATDSAQFVGAVRKAEERTMAKRVENARFAREAEASYRSILEDIEQYQRVERAILDSDASTYVETSRGKLTVAQALSLKRRLDGSDPSCEDLDFEENLCRKIRREYEEKMAEVKKNNRCLQYLKERAYLTVPEQGQDSTRRRFLEEAERYAEENRMNLADPLDILEKARSLTEENDRLLVELNTQIRLSNASTLVQISQTAGLL